MTVILTTLLYVHPAASSTPPRLVRACLASATTPPAISCLEQQGWILCQTIIIIKDSIVI